MSTRKHWKGKAVGLTEESLDQLVGHCPILAVIQHRRFILFCFFSIKNGPTDMKGSKKKFLGGYLGTE